LQCEVCLTDGILELLVCKSNSKEYESILSTQASASDLHAALLALGLTPGLPARAAVAPDRQTTVSLPPQGAELSIHLRWKDAKAAVHEASASDWLELSGMKPKETVMPKNWVFVGSDITPGGTYWADDDGDIISVSNFAASVIDVPFESSRVGRVVTYRTRTAAIPAKGTAVDVIIEPLPNAEHAPYARVIIELDRLGRCSLNGREIPDDELTNWGQKYIEDHSKGQVTLRVDGKALAYDIRHVQEQLRLAGIYDVDPYILQPSVAILPRSADEAKTELKGWDNKFQNPREFIRDPGQEVQELLGQIQVQQEELKNLQEIYGDYAQHLQAAAKKYQATSKPAKGAGEKPAGENR
jgi:biopolymer transport protein ExbD